MLKYKLTNENNKWKILLKSCDNAPSVKIDETVDQFSKCLLTDMHLLSKNINVTDCALNAPRLHSSLDKKTKIAHKMAFSLYPLINDESKPLNIRKKYSYIRYSKLISGLTRQFKLQLAKEEQIALAYKNIKNSCKRENFCELKKLPPSINITEPTAMPVDVAKLEELQPFFDYLQRNEAVINVENGLDYIQFNRGACYIDGRIDLCKQVVGSDWIGNLMKSITNNSYINHFLLGNNIIDEVGATEIAKFITNEHKPKITTWYLAGNRINANGIKEIAQALENDTDAIALWLKRNPIKTGSKYLGEMLKKNKKLRILDLHNTGLFDEGIRYLMDGLIENRTLRHLYVDANALTPIGATYIANYFNYLVERNEKGLVNLWMDMNRFDDEGISLIANSIKNYKYLKRLSVGSNRIGPNGAKILLDSLVNHEKLITLSIGLYKSTSDMGELPNNIGDLGVEYIVKFIENNKSVKVLNIEHNGISLDGIIKIIEAIQKNDNLLFVYYLQRGIVVPQEIYGKLRAKLTENIKKHIGITYGEFCNKHLRFIKHTKYIKDIDSIYRNNM